MKKMRTCIILLVLSIALSAPSLMRLPRVLPFLHADVRASAPKMLDDLRLRGLWLVNVDLEEVRRGQNAICFYWTHNYTARNRTENSEPITTCTNEEN